MAIDTLQKRQSALAQRFFRLPFGRRFLPPIPDGTIDQGDRQTMAGAYAGILAAAPVIHITSRPFYRPQRIDVQDSRVGRIDVADSRVGRIDVADSRVGNGDDQVI